MDINRLYKTKWDNRLCCSQVDQVPLRRGRTPYVFGFETGIFRQNCKRLVKTEGATLEGSPEEEKKH